MTDPARRLGPQSPSLDVQQPPTRTASRSVGTIVAVVLLCLLGLATLAVSAFGASLGSIGGACLEGGCTMLRIEAGWIAAVVLPCCAFAAVTAVTVVLAVQRREAWWVPLAGGPAIVIAFAFGWMLWTSGLAA